MSDGPEVTIPTPYGPIRLTFQDETLLTITANTPPFAFPLALKVEANLWRTPEGGWDYAAAAPARGDFEVRVGGLSEATKANPQTEYPMAVLRQADAEVVRAALRGFALDWIKANPDRYRRLWAQGIEACIPAIEEDLQGAEREAAEDRERLARMRALVAELRTAPRPARKARRGKGASRGR